NFPHGWEISAESGKELNEADGEKASSTGCLVDYIKRIGGVEPGDRNSFRFKSSPGILIGRKLFLEGDDAVAGAPSEPHRNRGNPFGGVLDQGDLRRRAIDQ